MGKYAPLWEYIQNSGQKDLRLSFEEIGRIIGMPLDHSFLQFKKELIAYGYQVGKISLKGQTVDFHQSAPNV